MTYTLYHVTTVRKLIIASDSWPLARGKARSVLRDAAKQLFGLDFPLKMLNFCLAKHLNKQIFLLSIASKKPNLDEKKPKSQTVLFDAKGLERKPNSVNLASKKPNWQPCCNGVHGWRTRRVLGNQWLRDRSGRSATRVRDYKVLVYMQYNGFTYPIIWFMRFDSRFESFFRFQNQII